MARAQPADRAVPEVALSAEQELEPESVGRPGLAMEVDIVDAADRPVAAGTLGRGAIATETLDEHCRAALAPYKVPSMVHLVARLPRSSAGKVVGTQLLRLLRETP